MEVAHQCPEVVCVQAITDRRFLIQINELPHFRIVKDTRHEVEFDRQPRCHDFVDRSR